VALVDGVKIGSGSLSNSLSPSGSGMSQIVLFFVYSFHPEPAMYPRTTHSSIIGVVFWTNIERPINSFLYRWHIVGYFWISEVMKWFGIICLVFSNQYLLIVVRMLPLLGMGWSMMTSNADTLSVEIKSNWSDKS